MGISWWGLLRYARNEVCVGTLKVQWVIRQYKAERDQVYAGIIWMKAGRVE